MLSIGYPPFARNTVSARWPCSFYIYCRALCRLTEPMANVPDRHIQGHNSVVKDRIEMERPIVSTCGGAFVLALALYGVHAMLICPTPQTCVQ
jgi:hypothetical protein